MISPGFKFARRVLVRVINHSSPFPSPDWKAAVSSQSISTPSNWLSLTKVASFWPTSTGSNLEDVGFQVAPKALTRSFTPASVQFFFKVVWIYWAVSPKTPPPMKYNGLLQTKAASTAPVPQVQKAKQMQLQGRVVTVQPGTPKPWAMAAGGHQELNLSTYVSLTGQSTVVPQTLLSLVIWKALADASKQRQNSAAIILFISLLAIKATPIQKSRQKQQARLRQCNGLPPSASLSHKHNNQMRTISDFLLLAHAEFDVQSTKVKQIVSQSVKQQDVCGNYYQTTNNSKGREESMNWTGR